MISSETCRKRSLPSGIPDLQKAFTYQQASTSFDSIPTLNEDLSNSENVTSMDFTISPELVSSHTKFSLHISPDLVTSSADLAYSPAVQSTDSSSILADILLACGLPIVPSMVCTNSSAALLNNELIINNNTQAYPASIQSKLNTDNNNIMKFSMDFHQDLTALDTSALHVLADPSLSTVSSSNDFTSFDPIAQTARFPDETDQEILPGNLGVSQALFTAESTDIAFILHDLKDYVESQSPQPTAHVLCRQHESTTSGYATDSDVDADSIPIRKRRRARVPARPREKVHRSYLALRTGQHVKRKLSSIDAEERHDRRVAKRRRPTHKPELIPSSNFFNTDDNLELPISLAGSWSGSSFSSSSSESSSGSDDSDDDSANRSDSDDDLGSSSSDEEDFNYLINSCPFTCPCRSSGNLTPHPPPIKRRKRFRIIESLREKLLRRRLLSHSNMWNSSCRELRCCRIWKKYRPTAVGVTKDYKNDDLHILRFSWGDWWPENGDKEDDDDDSY